MARRAISRTATFYRRRRIFYDSATRHSPDDGCARARRLLRFRADIDGDFATEASVDDEAAKRRCCRRRI